MKQVVQPVSGGSVEVLEVPCPVPEPAEVLVRTVASVISPGTERAVTALAQSSLLAKARARPDLVRQIGRKARAEGISATVRTVRTRLADDLALGYSAAGEVIAVGPAVGGISVGQLVTTGGAGKASHAEFQAVPGLLCAVVPAGVTPSDAAFTTVASIALHGLRLAETGPGSRVVVVGLGLVGQLAARLALASGCEVVGIDPAAAPREAASRAGVLALDETGEQTTGLVRDWSRGRGADAVLVCAATRSSDPMLRVPALCRDRAVVVVVGDVGLDLERTPLYEREISVRFARSYGPGRYDLSYEHWGVDYPAGHVRWTEGRNFEAVLDFLAGGRLVVSDLVTHSFDIAEADAAYRLIENRAEPYLAIQLRYPGGQDAAAADPAAPVSLGGLVPPARPALDTKPGPSAPGQTRTGPESGANSGVGWLGAGAFSAGTLLPAFRQAGFGRLVSVASASGLSARRLAERAGFARAVPGPGAVIDDPDVDVVVIATPHDTHAGLATQALKAGKHVWCEKPLALTEEELDDVERAWRESGRVLAVGFNRRWSPAVIVARRVLTDVPGPKLITYRVAAGPVPDKHWYRDRRHGGRLIGEACHFIDTAQALVGSPIEHAVAVGGDGAAGADDAVVSLRFGDGSLATIGYSSALPVAGKEWVEVLVGDRRVVIDDYRRVRANGKVIWKGKQDKGHQAMVGVFLAAIAGGRPVPTPRMIATMRATLAAGAARA